MNKTEPTSSALCVAPRSAMPCSDCRQPMHKIGSFWLHVATGKAQCSRSDLNPPPPEKPRWPHIGRHPQQIAHLREIVAKLETPMLPNTKAAVLHCLDTLRELLPPNGPSEPRGK